jgi:Raf kinase inhibitor-like YbhB/YbcL family protein
MAALPRKLTISSSAFEHEGVIPKKYTRDGQDVSPPLTIKGTPLGVLSLAIIVDDQDAPLGDFVHWVAWNLDPDLHDLEEGASLPHTGRNDFEGHKYQGPYPPKGKPHRYFFKVFALNTVLKLSEKTGKPELLNAMEGHILGKGELIGIYQRS